MRLQRISEIVYHRPWLITPSGHASIRLLLERKLGGVVASDVSADESEIQPERVSISLSDFIVGRPAPFLDENNIGHVFVMGAIGVGFSKIEKVCGNTDTEDLLQEVRSTIEKGATKLMMHFDSPGGMVGGTPEAAAELADLEVPWFSWVGRGRMSCSAAQWLACAADRSYAAPTGEVGSIGVYMPWIDWTAAYDEAGVKVKLIKNKEGDLKGAGYPGTSLTPEQEADWQKGCQQIFEMFAVAIRANRPGEISADTMRGQSFLAAEAKKRNLIDGVVDYEAAYRTLRSFKR